MKYTNLASIWRQGVLSCYRGAYWRFLWLMARSWANEPAKLRLGFMVLLSAHHLVIYARQVADELEEKCRELDEEEQSFSPEQVFARVMIAGD